MVDLSAYARELARLLELDQCDIEAMLDNSIFPIRRLPGGECVAIMPQMYSTSPELCSKLR